MQVLILISHRALMYNVHLWTTKLVSQAETVRDGNRLLKKWGKKWMEIMSIKEGFIIRI